MDECSQVVKVPGRRNVLLNLKSKIVHLLDRFDAEVLDHRFYWLCTLVSITLESWWPPGECKCTYCGKCREDWKRLEEEMDRDELGKS